MTELFETVTQSGEKSISLENVQMTQRVALFLKNFFVEPHVIVY